MTMSFTNFSAGAIKTICGPAFYELIEQNKRWTIYELLRKGLNPNHIFADHDNNSALHVAVDKERVVIVQCLISAGANINALNGLGLTPLMIAVQRESLYITTYLVASGAAVDIEGPAGITALHWAAKAGNTEAVACLLNSGKISIEATDIFGCTALFIACYLCYESLAGYLLSKGANPNVKDYTDFTCLHWAAVHGHEEIARLLLQAGCDVSPVDDIGFKPVQYASSEACLDVLLSFGATL